MKVLCVFSALLIVSVSVCDATRVDVSQPPTGGAVYEPFVMTDNWNGWHLLIGPVEIISSPFILLLGPVVGINAGLERAEEEPYSEGSSAWRMTKGIGAGFGTGLLMGPAVLVKGIYDTLTLGLFADGVFE